MQQINKFSCNIQNAIRSFFAWIWNENRMWGVQCILMCDLNCWHELNWERNKKERRKDDSHCKQKYEMNRLHFHAHSSSINLLYLNHSDNSIKHVEQSNYSSIDVKLLNMPRNMLKIHFNQFIDRASHANPMIAFKWI